MRMRFWWGLILSKNLTHQAARYLGQWGSGIPVEGLSKGLTADDVGGEEEVGSLASPLGLEIGFDEVEGDIKGIEARLNLEGLKVAVANGHAAEDYVGTKLFGLLECILDLEARKEGMKIAVEGLCAVDCSEPGVEAEPEDEVAESPHAAFDLPVVSLAQDVVVDVHFFLRADILDVLGSFPPLSVALDED